MCGIVGIMNFDKRSLEVQELKLMTNSLMHRGPDGEGFWISKDQQIGFGHRRLSIIDLSAAGHQPMNYLDRYTITYNGEIYNYLEIKSDLQSLGHKFKSNSDTEVVLAAFAEWGNECLSRFDGMFAFAIWDERSKKLFCARDRFGEKPFFYCCDGERLVFASEIKAFWAMGLERSINHRMMFNHLFYGAYFDPEDSQSTFFQGIRSLPNSCQLEVGLDGEIKLDRYFQIHLNEEKKGIAVEDAIEQFKNLLSNSVARRLRSDVVVGSSLSGGLDSSTIVAIINSFKQKSHIEQKTFSAFFDGFEKNERTEIERLIKAFSLDAQWIDLGNETFEDIIESASYFQDEPFTSLSVLAQNKVMKLASNHQVKVLIDGQGADETLAGYHWYFNSYFFEIFKKSSSSWREQHNAYKKLHSTNSLNRSHSSSYLKLALKTNFPYLNRLSKKYRVDYAQGLGKSEREYFETYKSERFESASSFNSLKEQLYHDTFCGPLQTLLRFADRNSMMHGIEVRLPYLEHTLVEFVFSLPAELKINSGWTKWLLRKAFTENLPREIVWKKEKIGFEPPVNNKVFEDRFKYLNKYYNFQ